MAELTDVAGRLIQTSSSLDALTQEISRGMNAAMAETGNFAKRDEDRNDTLDDIKELMKQLNFLQEDVGEIKDVVQQSIRMHTAQQRGERQVGDEGKLKDIPNFTEKYVRTQGSGRNPDQPKTEQASEKLAGIKPSDIQKVEIVNEVSARIISIPETKAQKTVGDEKLSIPGGAGVADPKKQRIFTQAGQKAILRQVRNMAGGVAGIVAAATGGISLSRIFDGLIKEEFEYDRIMGSIAKRQQAFGKDTAYVRKEYSAIADRRAIEARTAHKIGVFQKAQTKALQRGLKDRKKNEDFIQSALALSTLTLMSSETTTDLYASWSKHFAFSNQELGYMTRQLSQISRTTGLMGKNLEDVVKSSEKIQKNLRGIGVGTKEAAANVMHLMAQFKLHDIQGFGEEVADALGGGFLKADAFLQQALMGAATGTKGLNDAVMKGTALMDKRNSKILGENMAKTLSKRFGTDILKIDFTDPATVKKFEDASFALRLHSEKGADEWQRLLKSMITAGSTSADLQANALKSQIMTEERIKKLKLSATFTEADRQKMIADLRIATENKIADIRQSDRMDSLVNIADLAKAANKSREGMLKFREAMDKKGPEFAGKTAANFGDASQQAYASLKQSLAEEGIDQAKFDSVMKTFGDPAKMQGEMLKAIESNDPRKIAELTDKLLAFNQTAGVRDQVSSSTQHSMESMIDGINAELRQKISPRMLELVNAIGPKGVIAMAASATIVAAISSLGILLVTIFPKRMAALLTAPFKMLAGKVLPKRAAMDMAKLGTTSAKTGRFAKAGGHFGDMGRTLKTGAGDALKPMKTQLTKGGKFVKGSFENVLGPPLRGAANKLDDLGKATARHSGALKNAVKGSRVGQAVGRGKGFIGKQAGRAAGGIDTVARKAVAGGKWVKNTKAIKGLSTGVRTLGRSSTHVFGTLGKAGLQGARGIGATAKALTSWTIVIPLVLAGIDGFIGAMSASGKAAEIFGVKQDEVTNSMRMASEGAAFWTGILDGLTFGFASKWVGPTGTWTKSLAKVFDKFKILNIAMQLILVPMKVLWGVIKGLYFFLKNTFIGIWEGIKLAVEPLVDLFEWMGNSIGTALNDIGLGDFFNSTEGLTDIVGIISNAFAWLGKGLGWVFKQIGMVTGMIIKFLVPVFKVLWNVGMMIVKAVLRPIIDVFKSLWDVGKTFIALFTGSGSLKERFHAFGKSVMTFLLNFFGMVPKMIWNVIKGIGPMLWKGLVAGLTLIFTYGPKIVSWLWQAIKDGFSALTSGEFWVGVWDGLKSGLVTVGTVIMDAVSGFFGGMVDGAVEWLTKMYNDIVGWFKKMWYMIVGGSIIPDMVMDIIKWFAMLPIKIMKFLWGGLKKIGKLIWKGIQMWGDLIIGLWDKVIDFIGFDWLTNAWKNFKTMLRDPFGFLSKAWDRAKNLMKNVNPFNWDWENMWPDFLTKKYWSNMFSGWAVTLPDWLKWDFWSKKFKTWSSFEIKWPEWLKPSFYAKKFEEWTGIKMKMPNWMTSAYWGEKWDNFKMPKVFSIDWWVSTFSRIGTAIADTLVSSIDWVVNAITAAFQSMIGSILTSIGALSIKYPKGISWSWDEGWMPKVTWGSLQLFKGAATKGASMTASASKTRTGEAARQQINPLKAKAVESTDALRMYRKTLNKDSAKWSHKEYYKVQDLLAKQQADKTTLRDKIKEAGSAGGWTASRASKQERANEVSINKVWFEKNYNAWLGNMARSVEGIQSIQEKIAEAFADGVLSEEEKKMIKTAKVELAKRIKAHEKLMKRNSAWGSEKSIRHHGRHEGIPKHLVDEMVKKVASVKGARAYQDKNMVKIAGAMATQKIIDSSKKHIGGTNPDGTDFGNASDKRVQQLKQGWFLQNQKKVINDAKREAYLLANLEKMVVTLSANKDSARMAGATKEQLQILQTMIDKAKMDVGLAKMYIDEKKAISSIVIRQRVLQPGETTGPNPLPEKEMKKLLPDPKPMEKAAIKSTTPGSIYTHDIHVENVLKSWLGKLVAVGEYVVHIMKNPFGEVTLPKGVTGDTRTLTPEESAELKLQRHKTENSPRQVSVYSATTEEMQKIGLDQVTQLVAIKEGIGQLVTLLSGGNSVGKSDAVPGNTHTRYSGKSATLEWGEAPFSVSNNPNMQQVVSQTGVG